MSGFEKGMMIGFAYSTMKQLSKIAEGVNPSPKPPRLPIIPKSNGGAFNRHFGFEPPKPVKIRQSSLPFDRFQDLRTNFDDGGGI